MGSFGLPMGSSYLPGYLNMVPDLAADLEVPDNFVSEFIRLLPTAVSPEAVCPLMIFYCGFWGCVPLSLGHLICFISM